uniref:NADH-ubiquinone oxidoreductase chain 6 n=1 Tax=Podosphaera xanthii TaxID=135283 RepID=A0A6B9MUW2_9PEZI|nr:NADH dehydrogenase subunit 6 [Podosphaera xanthii]
MNELLLVVTEYVTNGFNVKALDILSLFALGASIVVITTKNPIQSLMSLIGLFGFISVYLILCGLTFIGFSYLIVYIGAVSILFLFILMLINIRSSELQSNNSNSIPLALFIVLLINYVVFEILPYSIAILNNYSNKINNSIYLDINNKESLVEYNYLIKFVTSNSWDGNINETGHVSAIGNILYTSYNIWLFMASFIILLAMVGAIVITVDNKKNNRGINSMVECLFYTQFVKGSSPLFLKDSLT